jgi:DNA-binding beta-propeller fold protein YncE
MWPRLEHPWYFMQPIDLAVDEEGNVYVADTDGRGITKLLPDGTPVPQFKEATEATKTVFDVHGIAIDTSGIYVADTTMVSKLSLDGKLAQQWDLNANAPPFVGAFSVAIDSSGNVYVVDPLNNEIRKLDPHGKVVKKWGGKGKARGRFRTPADIVVDDSDNVYVIDIFNHRVQKFTTQGKFITKWGRKGKGKGRFDCPHGIAVGPRGMIYVSDYNNGRIQKFTPEGKYLSQFSTKEAKDENTLPGGLAIDRAGNIYVAELANSSVKKFTSDGKLIAEWGPRPRGGASLCYPKDIVIDSKGNLYVADGTSDLDNTRIVKFDSEGKLIKQWRGNGTSDGDFGQINGLGIDSFENLYVAEAWRECIEKFSPDGEYLGKWGKYVERHLEAYGPGEFYPVYDVAVDSKGNVYAVSDCRLQKFTLDGEFVFQIGEYDHFVGLSDSEFHLPRSVVIDAEDNVYVADSASARGDSGFDPIRKYNPNGKLIAQWGHSIDGGDELHSIAAMALDSVGNLYVVEPVDSMVFKFSPEGWLLAKWGSGCKNEGVGAGQFNKPSGVAVDRKGHVYIADTNNHRIQIFRPKKKTDEEDGREVSR